MDEYMFDATWLPGTAVGDVPGTIAQLTELGLTKRELLSGIINSILTRMLVTQAVFDNFRTITRALCSGDAEERELTIATLKDLLSEALYTNMMTEQPDIDHNTSHVLRTYIATGVLTKETALTLLQRKDLSDVRAVLFLPKCPACW